MTDEERDGDVPEGNTWTPLTDCDRETRLSAFRDGFVERLLLSAADQLDEAVTERETALKGGKTFVDAIEHASARRSKR